MDFIHKTPRQREAERKEKRRELKEQELEREVRQKLRQLSNEEIDNRTKWHPPTSDEVARLHGLIRGKLNKAIKDVNELVPEGREKVLAITKLEEAMMWANAGIARNQ